MSQGRLFKIMYILMSRTHVTASELAEELEVSIRTIYRDFDKLSSAGIPIYTEVGRNGGVCLLDHFVLDKVLFTEQEKQEVLFALQSRMVSEDPIQKAIIEKLSALFQMSADDWLEVDFSRWKGQQDDQDKFGILKQAILQHRIVHIAYVSSYGTFSERDIQPLKLSYKDKAWYLKAYCLYKHDFRIFKCNRIAAYEISDEQFTPISFQPGKDEENYEGTKIILKVERSCAYRIYDEFSADQVEQQENGDFLIHAAMPVDAWLIGYLLSFGTQLEVLHPSYIRDILAAQAKEIYEKHKS